MLLALIVQVAFAQGAPSSAPYSLEPRSFVEMAKGDLATLKMLVAQLKSVSNRAAANRDLFAAASLGILNAEQKRTLLSTWGALYGSFAAIEGLRHKYWGFVKLLPTDPRHSWGYLLTHTALTALLAHGMRFSELALNHKQLETLLDEANGEFGVPAGAFARFKEKAIHVKTATQLVTGDTWATTVLPKLQSTHDLGGENVAWALEEMRVSSKQARLFLQRSGIKLFAGNAKDIVADSTVHTLFPVQKTFAAWMGDTRVARSGQPLISKDFVERHVLPKLEPGDIIVTRQNWFLSNIGLPGFWPHAELYLGRPEAWARLDADALVQSWLSSQPERTSTLAALLQRRFPEKWSTYAVGVDFQGHSPIRVIESISEGVSFTAIEHAFGVDYLAAMRPRRSPLDIVRAIERAFRYQGRPYDFDFDFYSDATLVCTELVFKAFQSDRDMKGLEWPLVDVAGRKTLPANEIVKRFDLEFDAPAKQLDFVLFVDALEKERAVFQSDTNAFRQSWRRVKWDIAQR
jgi:hypothetical protein